MGGAPWSHITLGPADPWVDREIKGEPVPRKEGDHLTYLLWARQVNPEAEKSFHATNVRLETPLAVQHQSQWHVDLDPRFQHLTLHWLRVVRDGQATDYRQRERMRLIQRETQLERHVLDGTWTLLVVLDDVRPGDIIEAGYTYHHHHPIRRGGCEEFYFVPPRVVVGRFHFSVFFQPSRRALAWKASTDAPAREITTLAEDQVRWTWNGSQRTPREEEPNQPATFLDYIWMQVSDLASWAELSHTIAAAWDKHAAPDVAALPFARPALVDRTAIVAFIRQVQDEFRYLSVDLESGGWIPALPGEVARRRYGDCKHLAWMAVTVLRSWGVTARPILVGSGLRDAVASLLPTSRAFNHAVLEISLEGESRWFDLTLRSQGGSFQDMPVNWYGFGLALDASADGLVAQPGKRTPNLYLIREIFLVDTRKSEPSLVERRLRVEGWQADNIRARRLSQGADEFAKERLEEAKRRFGKARARGQILWRDNRDQNVCELVETYEIDDAVYASIEDKRAMLDLPANLIVQSFPPPPDKARRAPWDLPHPLEIRHRITILHKTLGRGPGRRRSWSSPEVTALLDESYDAGEWSKTAHYIVNRDEIAPERVAAFRADLEKFAVATSWRLHMPWDEGRSDPYWQAGELPEPKTGQTSYVSAVQPAHFPAATEQEEKAYKKEKAELQSSTPSARDDSFNWRLLIPIFFALSFIARSCTDSH